MKPLHFRGRVERGRARGRELGFPTANLALESPPKDLEQGVYVGRVHWDEGPLYGVLVNWGNRPTFGGEDRAMELHILDFSGNLYGKVLDLTIFERLRDEQYFAAKELLIRQIEMDLEQARRILDNT